MLKKTGTLHGILACLLALGLMEGASAGDVKLVSDTLDHVCAVDITWGVDAPNNTPIEVHADVPKNWSITKPDKLCYRRPTTPDNCDSGMTQWKTPWKCAASAGSDTQELSLK